MLALPRLLGLLLAALVLYFVPRLGICAMGALFATTPNRPRRDQSKSRKINKSEVLSAFVSIVCFFRLLADRSTSENRPMIIDF